MTRVDLITGFLGAGKTTFIHEYLHHMSHQRILIIENEFCSVGVDAAFLKAEDCPIEDLSGVCMCCKGRDQFVSMLLNAAAEGYDRVLVEPSGIYDVDEFFGVMNEVRDQCEIGSVLAIVDAHAPDSISDESRYLMFSQIMAAGMVILSKTQLQTPEALPRTLEWLNALIRDEGGHRVLGDDVCVKDWDDLTEEDFVAFQNCGCYRDSHRRQFLDHADLYGSYMTADYCRGEADLRERIDGLLKDPKYGRVIRVKGFIRDYDKNWYEVNCTRQEVSVKPAANLSRGLLVVIGQDLDDKALRTAFLPRLPKNTQKD